MGFFPSRADVPQQELPREPNRRAAWPYFSFTVSFRLTSVMALLLRKAGDFLGLNCFVAGAALGIEKRQKLPQGFGIGRVAKIGAFAAHPDQLLVLELVQMVGERGCGDAELGADLVDEYVCLLRGRQQPQ